MVMTGWMLFETGWVSFYRRIFKCVIQPQENVFHNSIAYQYTGQMLLNVEIIQPALQALVERIGKVNADVVFHERRVSAVR